MRTLYDRYRDDAFEEAAQLAADVDDDLAYQSRRRQRALDLLEGADAAKAGDVAKAAGGAAGMLPVMQMLAWGLNDAQQYQAQLDEKRAAKRRDEEERPAREAIEAAKAARQTAFNAAVDARTARDKAALQRRNLKLAAQADALAIIAARAEADAKTAEAKASVYGYTPPSSTPFVLSPVTSPSGKPAKSAPLPEFTPPPSRSIPVWAWPVGIGALVLGVGLVAALLGRRKPTTIIGEPQ